MGNVIDGKFLKMGTMNAGCEVKKGIIFSIEEFAINDGPGIRTTIFFKGCPLHCVWCHNPEGISPEPQYMHKRTGVKLCGYIISSEELAAQILRNKEIFRLNNGGVTLTGGEPLAQPAFLIDFLNRIKPDVHTTIETSGYASLDTFKKVLPWIDLFLFDIKLVDSQLHKKYTGVGNEPIRRNFEYLCSSGKDFIVRIPLIPGVNDTEENMRGVLELIKGVPSLKRVELLRYNKMAGAKYPMIGKEYNPPFNTQVAPHICDVFTEHAIETIVL